MYQVLYRKYRPKCFEDVVGQDFVVKTLQNSIINKKISHAYMFFGPRGIGKTTIAKIFSRTVNCENPINGNICGKCDSCLKSLNSVDIIEIDAASNNGVDEIREIKSKVNIVPSELKYKVYIIDEVHMLTSGAFNALLKTLEEPPQHVIFILATTDPQKVSETIISRCQCYSFKRISVENIVAKLSEVSKKEKIKINQDVLQLIAEYSDGGLRDALGVLDKLSSYKTDEITVEDYYEINDMITENELNSFKNSIVNFENKNIIEKIKNYSNSGKNLIEIITQLLILLRNDLVNYYESDNQDRKVIKKYQDLANLINESMFDMKKSGNPKIYIEIMLLNYANAQKNISQRIDKNTSQNISQQIDENTSQNISQEIKGDNNSLKNISQTIKDDKKMLDKMKNVSKNIDLSEKIDKKEENTNVDEKANTLINNSNLLEINDIRINNVLAKAEKKEKIKDLSLIDSLNEYVFDQKIGYIISEILNATLEASSSDAIILSYEYESVVETNLNNIEQITKVYNEKTNSNKKIAIISTEKWNKIKKEYINSTKKGEKYDIIEEPELVINKIQENESNGEQSPLDLFKDIVEIK